MSIKRASVPHPISWIFIPQTGHDMRIALSRLSLLLCLLALSPVVHAQIAVVMSPGSASMTKVQVANIYLGRRFDLKPIDLPDGVPLRATFYRAAADADLTQVRSAWARIIFTGRGEAPRELPDAAAVKKAVASNPRAIGYIDAAALDSTVRAVLILP